MAKPPNKNTPQVVLDFDVQKLLNFVSKPFFMAFPLHQVSSHGRTLRISRPHKIRFLFWGVTPFFLFDIRGELNEIKKKKWGNKKI